MASTLPAHPHLTHLKHEAKQLLRAHREGKPAACAVLRNLKHFGGKKDSEVLAAPVALQEVQHALAKEYGFGSWNALRAHVESLRGREDESAQPSLVNPQSLWATIDAINESFFAGRPLTRTQRKEAAAFIAERQGKPRSYRGMFGPVDGEEIKGSRVFSGERVESGVGSQHILGQEACRALRLLDDRGPQVRQALQKASQWIEAWLPPQLSRPTVESVEGLRGLPGMYCCMMCSCALWRHLLARGPEHEAFLELGVKALKAHRDGQGQWRGWPFRYTLLALSEMRTPAAIDEMRYAAKDCEQELARRLSKTKIHSQRWRTVLERVLALV